MAGKGFVGTGQTGATYYKDFYAYDAASNSWASVSPFAGRERYGAVSFTINDKAYVGTGRTANGAVGDFFAYDAATDAWTAVTGTGARQNAAAFSVNGKGYVASGVSYNGGTTTVMSDVREYDPATDSWTTKISADTKLSSKHTSAAVTFNSKGYILGGNSSNTVVIYDPSGNSLTTGSTFSDISRRSGPVAFLANGDVYTGLGYVNSTNAYRNDMWKLEVPKAPEAPTNLSVEYTDSEPPNGPGIVTRFYDNSSNEEGFVLARSTDGGVSYTVVNSFNACSGCNMAESFSPYTELATYFYKAGAYNSVDTTYSEPIVFTVPLRRPHWFSMTEVSDHYVKFLVAETRSSLAKNYVIQRALASEGVFSPLDTVTASEINKGYADFSVETGQTYSYFVYGISESA